MWMSEHNPWKFTFYNEGPGDETWIFRLGGGKHLCLLKGAISLS